MSNAPRARRALVGLLSISFCMLGCDGGSTPRTDAGPGADGDDAATRDGAIPRPDGGTPATDSGPPDPVCVPTGGSASETAYCDFFRLALIDDGSGAVEARLRGRLSPRGLAPEGCATVDSIEVQEFGVTVGTLAGVGAFSVGDQNASLARGPALPEMMARCGGDTDRFGGFGFIIHGRMDGGTFEGRCADAEGGGRWPPALVVSCHRNVDEPAFSTYAMVDNYGGSLTLTTIQVAMPHGPGGALTTVDGTARIIAHADPFGGGLAPEPFDITTFGGSVSEGDAPGPGPYTNLYLSTMSDPLGLELCPIGWDGRGTPPGPPPVMLVRLTGAGERGAYSTEAYLDMCTRIPPRP